MRPVVMVICALCALGCVSGSGSEPGEPDASASDGAGDGRHELDQLGRRGFKDVDGAVLDLGETDDPPKIDAGGNIDGDIDGEQKPQRDAAVVDRTDSGVAIDGAIPNEPDAAVAVEDVECTATVDSDENGYADDCDKLLATMLIPSTMKNTTEPLLTVMVSGQLGNSDSDPVFLFTSPRPDVFTKSFDVLQDTAAGEAAAYLHTKTWSINARLCGGGLCWSPPVGVLDLRGKHVTRFVVAVDAFGYSETHDQVLLGGRWEVRGY